MSPFAWLNFIKTKNNWSWGESKWHLKFKSCGAGQRIKKKSWNGHNLCIYQNHTVQIGHTAHFHLSDHFHNKHWLPLSQNPPLLHLAHNFKTVTVTLLLYFSSLALLCLPLHAARNTNGTASGFSLFPPLFKQKCTI